METYSLLLFALAEWPMVPVCCMYSTLFICALKKKLGKFLITRAFNWYSVENWIMLWPNIKENLNLRYVFRCSYTLQSNSELGLENRMRQTLKRHMFYESDWIYLLCIVSQKNWCAPNCNGQWWTSSLYSGLIIT